MKVLQGIDITGVRRIQKSIERQGEAFVSRIFTPHERAYCEPKKRKYEHFAARFAAKEALMKALEVNENRRCDFSEIEVRHRPTGKPYLVLSASALKSLKLPRKIKLELSLTHEREYAMASVLVMIP